MRKHWLFIAVLLVSGGLFSLSPLAAQGGETLIVALDVQGILTLDPGRAYEVYNLPVMNAIYDTLLTVPADDLTALEPRLAESWEISEDGLEYTFHLRPGIQFSSGNPLTAEDVRFSWTRLKNIKGNPSFFADAIESIEVIDDLTLKVTLNAVTPAFLTIVTVPAMSVLDSAVVREHGGTDAEDADVTDTAQAWLDQNSAGTGPFILTGLTPNTQVTLVRNENYWGEPANFAGVTLIQVNDSTTALQQLERGDIDIADNIEKDLAEQVANNPELQLIEGSSLNLSYLALSPDEELGGPLADRRVRQAIASAIDYDGILQGLLLGYTDRPPAMLPLGVQGSDPSLRWERDLDRARALLEEAGYGDGLDLTLSIGSGGICGIPSETITAKIQADLAEVGINVTSDIQQSSNFLSAYRAQELPMLLSTWSPDYLDATMWSDYFSNGEVGPAFRIKMNSQTIAELAEEAGLETDPEARRELYRQWQQAHVEEAVFIPLCQNKILIAADGDIQNIIYHPVYIYDFAVMDIAE